MRLREKKRRGKVNPETSREQSNWIPSFHSYEDFKCKTLQSLDGFMIILSTDGVIIFVAGNITCLLGHLPDEIVGKKLLSLLPDHEKNEVYRKIALKLPLSNSGTDLGKHIDFCCHLRRGNVEHDSRPTYEYVKFILTVKDISTEPLVLFSSFFPSHSYAESSPTYLPLEDRFYMVGSICVLRDQTLRELFTVKKAGEEVLLIQDSDEEHASPERRSQGQKRSFRMESLPAESAASDDQADIVAVEQYDPQESVHVISAESDTYDSSTSSLESILASPAPSSSQSFECEPEVEKVYDMDEVPQGDEVEEVEQVADEKEVEQLGQGEQEARSASSAAAGICDEVHFAESILFFTTISVIVDFQMQLRIHNSSPQPLQLPPSITSYINKRELELMKKFKEQLDETTQMLQADIRSQQDALEMMKEQLQRMQDSSFQMQPTVSHHLDRPEPQSLEPVPKKQRTEQMESLPDLKEISLSHGSRSSHSFICPEELEEPCDVSSQLPLQGQDPFLQQQLQQVQDQHTGQQLLPEQQMQERPQQPSATVGNQMLQICLPGQASVAVPLCEDPTTFMQTQPIVVPVQLVAGQQPSGYYQDETLGDDEDDSHSFLSEEQQGVSMDPLPLVYSPGSDTVASTSFPQSPINSDSSLVTLETPQDYIQLWQQPPDPQHHLYLHVNTWPSSEQTALQDQATWPQMPAPEASPEAFEDPDEYSPGRIGYFMSAELSDLDEHQHQQYFRTKP
ncbi:circadian clock protein PASD1 [Ursus americanus]|uniref:circadian clock protein PASD1 n=1 Tax=Ursus americanus TaxID=9643 RepID=UPI001E67ABB1|nr:circadian clock protein PASD1 [Ursus americanus]